MPEIIKLHCWDCRASYASPKDHPCCPNCGWKPERLVQTCDGTWADPAHLIVGVPYNDIDQQLLTKLDEREQFDDGGEPF